MAINTNDNEDNEDQRIQANGKQWRSAKAATERAIALKMGIGKDWVPDKRVRTAALNRGKQEVSLMVKLDLATVHLVDCPTQLCTDYVLGFS